MIEQKKDKECIPWMTTTVGHLPAGEQSIVLDLIDRAMPVLWKLGGEKRLKTNKEGLHIIVTRRKGYLEYFGEFRYGSRALILDAGATRSLTLNRWRRRLVVFMAHELMHARQFFRGPATYTCDLEDYAEYLRDPPEVEARREENIVKRALGLKSTLKDNMANRRRVEEYRDAFERELLPLLRETDHLEDKGGAPTAGLPLSKRQVAELLDDLTNYMSVRTIRGWDSRTQATAARWWMLARGTSVSNVMERRSLARQGVWLASGMVQRGVRAEFARELPKAADLLKRVLPDLTPCGILDGWDVRVDDGCVLVAGLAKLQHKTERESAGW